MSSTSIYKGADSFEDLTKPKTHYPVAPTTSRKQEDDEQQWTIGQNRMNPEPYPPVRVHSEAWKRRIRIPSGLTFTRYHMDINALDKVADCSAPEPELNDQNFEGMPFTDNFSLDHEWTDENDGGIYDDIQLLKNKHELQVGPLAKKMAVDMNRIGHCPWGLTIKTDSTSSDPLGEYSLLFPSGWQEQEFQFKTLVDEKARHLLHTEMLSLLGARRNYYSRIQNGLDTFLDLGNEPQNRVLLVSLCTLEEVSEELRLQYPSAYAIRKLNHTECCYLSNNCVNLKMRKIKIIGDNAFDISFGSREEMYKLFSRCPTAVNFPIKLESDLSSNDNEVYGQKLSWYPYPSVRQAELTMKSPKDVGYACFVLNEHSIRALPTVSSDSQNKQIRMTLYEGDVESYDNETFEHKIKIILNANSLEYDRIRLFRTRERPIDAHALWQRIHQRIGRAAMHTQIWETVPGEIDPYEDNKWVDYINKHHHTLPWKVNLDAYTPPHVLKEKEQKRLQQEHKRSGSEEFDGLQGFNSLAPDDPLLGVQRTATVTFKSRDVAEKIIDYLQPITPRMETFAFTRKDRRGVRFSPFYRIQRNVPHCVRGVINEFLEKEEADFQATSDYNEDNWCQYLDGPLNTQMIVLQGWPIARVKAAAERLEQRLAGVEIDCSVAEGAGRLLYGVGLAYVNKTQRENKGKVVISISRLEKKMWIIGSLDEDCPATRDKLMHFCQNREKYTIKYSISLAKPRFLGFFKEYIRSLVANNNINELRHYLGNPNLKMFGPELRFHGNVVQYERLQELLDSMQKKMIDSYQEVFPGTKFQFRDINCPLCLAQVTQSNYRLTICGHLYCQDCLCQMISFQMKNNELPVRCRYAKEGRECLERVAVRDVMLLLFDKNFCLFPYFFKGRLEQLLRATTDFAIKKSKGRLRHCPRPDCKGLFWKNEESSAVEGQTTCGVCSFRVCHNCFYPPHPGVSCEVETALRQSADESINYFMTRLKGRAKRCPNENCRGVIEKDAGCNHLHCLFCQTHFCWLCDFTDDHESQIYAHLRTVHGGTGGGYDFLDFPPGLGPPPGFPIHDPPLMNLQFGQNLHILGIDEDLVPNGVFEDDEEDVDVLT